MMETPKQVLLQTVDYGSDEMPHNALKKIMTLSYGPHLEQTCLRASDQRLCYSLIGKYHIDIC